jgi:CheY-like chemotaxis protein
MAKILIVEDNPKNRDMLSRRLIKRGYDVVLAVDGQEGIDMVSSENPDLILLDMSLPVIDGWGVARHLKADDATKTIPIIALTAHAMAGDREKTLEAGCDEYSTKPIRLPELLEKMESFLNA